MLEITTPGMEHQLAVDFAQVYKESDLARSVASSSSSFSSCSFLSCFAVAIKCSSAFLFNSVWCDCYVHDFALLLGVFLDGTHLVLSVHGADELAALDGSLIQLLSVSTQHVSPVSCPWLASGFGVVWQHCVLQLTCQPDVACCAVHLSLNFHALDGVLHVPGVLWAGTVSFCHCANTYRQLVSSAKTQHQCMLL